MKREREKKSEFLWGWWYERKVSEKGQSTSYLFMEAVRSEKRLVAVVIKGTIYAQRGKERETSYKRVRKRKS
jgi:hypothetical protein